MRSENVPANDSLSAASASSSPETSWMTLAQRNAPATSSRSSRERSPSEDNRTPVLRLPGGVSLHKRVHHSPFRCSNGGTSAVMVSHSGKLPPPASSTCSSVATHRNHAPLTHASTNGRRSIRAELSFPTSARTTIACPWSIARCWQAVASCSRLSRERSGTFKPSKCSTTQINMSFDSSRESLRSTS